MSSIFTIPNWTASVAWRTNDIVKKDNLYYYALRDINVSEPFSRTIFGGYSLDDINVPLFLWQPSYGTTTKENMKLRINQYNDGFEQRSVDGINNSFLELDLSFNDRDDLESRAIIHFLYNRNGVESFYFMPPFPYNRLALFICSEWQHGKDYINNNSIKAKFIEKFN